MSAAEQGEWGEKQHFRDSCGGPGDGSEKLVQDSKADNERTKGPVAWATSPSALFYKLHEMPNVLKQNTVFLI